MHAVMLNHRVIVLQEAGRCLTTVRALAYTDVMACICADVKQMRLALVVYH